MKHLSQLPYVVWFAVVAVLMPAAGSAQADDWLAWQGCWRAEGAAADEYLCVAPAGPAGVRLVTVAGGAVVLESRVFADGRARPVQTDGCTGSEVAIWSADSHRVFLRSQLSCEGGVQRQASGIFAFAHVGGWVSVQSVTIDGRTATRTARYTAVDDAAAPPALRAELRRSPLDRASARSLALLPVDASDVEEAVEHVEPAAVQEWLTATEQPFQLADELAPPAGGVVAQSALDHAAAFGYDARPASREVVHVVERPVYVTHTHVHEYRYRACWDPFFSGVVIGLGRGVTIGVGHTHCGRSYTRYSPWGYDLFGWRVVYLRPVILRGRPIIRYHMPSRQPTRIRYTGDRDRDRYTGDRDRYTGDRDRNPGDRDRYTRPPRQEPPPRQPARPRDDGSIRTAQPRDGAPPLRTAQPRNTTTPSTRGSTSSVRGTATPQRGAQTTRTGEPPSRTVAPPTRAAVPRSATPPARSTAPPRTQPASRTGLPSERPAHTRSSPPPRETRAQDRRSPPTTHAAPPRTSSAGSTRVARPRGGG